MVKIFNTKVGQVPTLFSLEEELQVLIKKFDKCYQLNEEIIDCDPRAFPELYVEQERIEDIMVTLEVFRKKDKL